MSLRQLHKLLERPSCHRFAFLRHLSGPSCHRFTFLRHLSSKSDLPPWFIVPKHYERPPDAIKELLVDASRFRKDFEKKALKDMFEKEIKPSLIARCMWLPKSMEKSDVKKLHFINKRIIGRLPLYVTSLTLSRKWVTLRKDVQENVLNFLAVARVMVDEDWEHEGPSIDVLFYDHGLQFAPQSGSSADITYKAECDASYYKKSKTATAASIIWKCGTMIDAQISWGLSCCNSGHAEALALCNVLTRGKEVVHKIKKLDVVIDHEENCRIMSGAQEVPSCDYSNVYIACIQTSKQYEICKVRWQPREMLGLVKEMAKADYSKTVNLTEILEGKAGYVLGAPFLRIHQSKKEVIDKLGEVHVDTDQIFYPVSYYLKVQDDLKYDALFGMVRAIRPWCLIVMVGCEDLAYKIAINLTSKYSVVVKGGSCLADDISATKVSAKKPAFVVINDEEVPPFPSELKTLLICYDELPIHYTDGQNISQVKIVNFISDEKFIQPKWKEVDPFLFGFLHSQEVEKEQEKFRVLTYNLCGEDKQNLCERIFALKDLIEHHRPDIICFQNVTPKMHLFMQKFRWWGEYFCSRSYPEASDKEHYILQMSRFPVKSFDTIPFANSPMQRELCTADVSLTKIVSKDESLAMKTRLVLATCHLEGTSPLDGLHTSEKVNQAEDAFRILAPHRNAILCGDMNWNEEVDGKFPVPSDCWVDAWDEVAEGKEGGETYLLPADHTKSTRSDRVFCKVSDYKLDKIEIVGKDSMISPRLGIVTTIHRVESK